MASWFDLALRLEAHHQGRAVPCSARRLAHIREDALIICPISMAAEHPTIHAVALGGLSGRPEVLFVGDPRDRVEQDDLYARLLHRLWPRMEAAARNEDWVQIIVPSESALGLFQELGEYLPHLRFDDAPAKQRAALESAQKLGRVLRHFAERGSVAGQQSVLTATNLLRSHWTTGQAAEEDAHLGVLMAWIEASEGELDAALRAARETTMGVTTDPAWDQAHLEPAIANYAKARKGSSEARKNFAAMEIRKRLESDVLLPIFQATQRAVRLVQESGRPPLPGLDQLCEREQHAFAYWMRGVEEGYRVARRDSTKAAVLHLLERENALETWQAVLVFGDPVARARARWEGEVLAGEITALDPPGRGRAVEIRTGQRWLRLRRGDVLCAVAEPGLKLQIEELRREVDGDTTVRLTTSAHHNSELLEVGNPLELAGGAPDWGGLRRARKRVADRLAELPDTHDPEFDAEAVAVPPADEELIDALDALRKEAA